MANVNFSMPNVPDDFAVNLEPANLRRIKFSALEYRTLRRDAIEYIKTYFPNDFNDFVKNSGMIMLLEALSAIGGKISLRGDLLTGEGFLPLANTEFAVINHLALINQRLLRQRPATVDIEITLLSAVATEVHIQAGLQLQAPAADGQPVTFELYRAPGDFANPIVIPANKRGVIAYAIEGTFATPARYVSAGGPNQTYALTAPMFLEAPVTITVRTGDTDIDWRVTTKPIETFGPTDKVVEVLILGDDVVFKFGDDVAGAAPLPGQEIIVAYRTGGGSRGRIGAGQIDELRQVIPRPPITAPTTIRLRNLLPSVGGVDKETLAAAKKRAPREFAMHKSITTAGDYAHAASSYVHPVFGAVVKAVCALYSDINANLVRVFCLALGADGAVVSPSAGLKQGLRTYLSDFNVTTDVVEVVDGGIYPVDVDIKVIVSRGADATVVKARVEAALTDYFDYQNWEMGKPLYYSDLIEILKSIDGVLFVDLVAPTQNILPSDGEGVYRFSDLIVEGTRTISYYYESARTVQRS